MLDAPGVAGKVRKSFVGASIGGASSSSRAAERHRDYPIGARIAINLSRLNVHLYRCRYV